jgi:hypothetical protein
MKPWEEMTFWERLLHCFNHDDVEIKIEWVSYIKPATSFAPAQKMYVGSRHHYRCRGCNKARTTKVYETLVPYEIGMETDTTDVGSV